MAKTRKQLPVSESELTPIKSSSSSPLVFISHDSRDAALAEAFSKILSSVSAGVLKSFRSSDHRTTQGIEYGVEWYPAIRNKLAEAGDVVAILTPRSLERPWILFECGIARGKLDERGREEKKIKGLALGLPLSKIVGPFAQFQNCPFEIPAITKLVMELVAQIPNSEPDRDAIEMQTTQFFEKAKELVAGIEVDAQEPKPAIDDTSTAKLFEEVKVMFQDLPSRVEARISDAVTPFRRRKGRRFHAMMIENFIHEVGASDDPIGLLIAASIVRDEMPWFYVLAKQTYDAIRQGDRDTAKHEINRLQHLANHFVHGPFREMFDDKETHGFMMDFPRMLDHIAHRCVDGMKATPQTTRPRKKGSKSM